MFGAEAGLQIRLPDMSGPDTRHVWVSDTPIDRFLLGAITPPPPQLGWPLSWLVNTLNQLFLSSKPLSSKLHSHPSFLREIWAISLSDSQDLQATHFTDDLHGFVTLGDMSPWRTRCCLGVTKLVVKLEKFVLPSPSWGFDSGKLN
jgi:hypothetical protein